MKFDMNGCPRDASGLPMVPPGRFAKFREAGLPPHALTRFQQLPVLQGFFDQGTLDYSQAKHCGVSLFRTEPVPIVAVRMQVGPLTFNYPYLSWF